MHTKSWTYLYLKQRTGGKKTAGSMVVGLFFKLGMLVVAFFYGILLGALLESGFLSESCCLIIGLLLVFIIDMIIEEDRILLLPFLSREPRSKIVKRELLLNIFSIANLYSVCLLLQPFLFVISEDSNLLVILFAALSSYSAGGIIWQLCERIKQKIIGRNYLRFIFVGMAGVLTILLIFINGKVLDADLIAYLGTPVEAVGLLSIFALSSAMSKKAIAEDLYNIYGEDIKRDLVKSRGKAAFSCIPVATGYLFRCPGVRNQFFTLTILAFVNIVNFSRIQPMVGVALCICAAACLLLPNASSYMSAYMGGMFTRPDIMKKVLDTSYLISCIVTAAFTIAGGCYLVFISKTSVLPAIALFVISVGPMSFISMVSNIYPHKYDLWAKKQSSSLSCTAMLLSFARLGTISLPTFLIPLNETYFSWAFIILGTLFLPFYPMLRDFVCSEIKDRKYSLFEKFK